MSWVEPSPLVGWELLRLLSNINVPDIGHIEPFDRSMLLQPIPKREPVFFYRCLENIRKRRLEGTRISA